MSNLLFQQLHLWFRRMCSMCRHHPCFVQIWQVFTIIRTTMLHNKQLDHCHQQHHHHQGEDLQRDIPCWRTCLCPCCGYPLGHCQGRQEGFRGFRYGGLGYRLSMDLCKQPTKGKERFWHSDKQGSMVALVVTLAMVGKFLIAGEGPWLLCLNL